MLGEHWILLAVGTVIVEWPDPATKLRYCLLSTTGVAEGGGGYRQGRDYAIGHAKHAVSAATQTKVGNVCVAGDALHQGGCSALEDGVVLASKTSLEHTVFRAIIFGCFSVLDLEGERNFRLFDQSRRLIQTGSYETNSRDMSKKSARSTEIQVGGTLHRRSSFIVSVLSATTVPKSRHRVKEDLELDGQAHYKVPADLSHNKEGPENAESMETAVEVKRWPVIVEESSDESEVLDCETIVSTYSNFDNHPGKIGAPEGRRKKLAEKVNDATSLRKDEQKRKQHVQEYSKEEKKERKGAVKEERREVRRVKKEVKRIYTGVLRRNVLRELLPLLVHLPFILIIKSRGKIVQIDQMLSSTIHYHDCAMFKVQDAEDDRFAPDDEFEDEDIDDEIDLAMKEKIDR
ncbi:hypothetical protein RHSIM_Rhsim06G0017000 [Rhododendron simsii]|uniref:Uncharacterized protein n=1 Tax=Rhododendron simsii TaxID=118357 RepID=A0A834LJY8_RHOSS|nr:hypothetical protein RHSIM_Rhsim06G0017000 [Rhododendron simsii]